MLLLRMLCCLPLRRHGARQLCIPIRICGVPARLCTLCGVPPPCLIAGLLCTGSLPGGQNCQAGRHVNVHRTGW